MQIYKWHTTLGVGLTVLHSTFSFFLFENKQKYWWIICLCCQKCTTSEICQTRSVAVGWQQTGRHQCFCCVGRLAQVSLSGPPPNVSMRVCMFTFMCTGQQSVSWTYFNAVSDFWSIDIRNVFKHTFRLQMYWNMFQHSFRPQMYRYQERVSTHFQ